MDTNVTISDIDAYFLVSVIAEVEVNENNLNHYAPLPANYSEEDYKSDRIKLRNFVLKREADLTKDNLTEKEKLDVKAIKKRIAEYPVRDKEPHKVGDIIETRRIRSVETESDLEWVYKWHLKKRLENNAFANIFYFINDEIKLVQLWINWVAENNPNWDKRDMLHQYIELLNTKLKEHNSQQQDNNISTAGPFKLAKKGARISLIKILYALHKLNLVQYSKNEGYPTLSEFMNDWGKFFGIDLKEYNSDLVQIKPQKDDEVLKDFSKMQSIILEYARDVKK